MKGEQKGKSPSVESLVFTLGVVTGVMIGALALMVFVIWGLIYAI